MQGRAIFAGFQKKKTQFVGPKKPKIAHEGQLVDHFLALLKEKSFLNLRTCGMPTMWKPILPHHSFI